jgi:hypothetical protein
VLPERPCDRVAVTREYGERVRVGRCPVQLVPCAERGELLVEGEGVPQLRKAIHPTGRRIRDNPPERPSPHRPQGGLDAWRVFAGLDPSLPDKLLPANWPRAQAREVFTALYDGLAPLAALRFQQIIAVHDDALAELTERRTTAVWTTY